MPKVRLRKLDGTDEIVEIRIQRVLKVVAIPAGGCTWDIFR